MTAESLGRSEHLNVRLESTKAFLRPIAQRDYEQLRNLELAPNLAHRWRLGPAQPSPESYAASLWAGVTAQFLIVAKNSGLVIGLVACYNHDATNGHAQLAAARFDDSTGSRSAFLDGLMMFIDYLFDMMPLRKLYAETPEYSAQAFRSGLGRLLKEEGRLRGHRYHQGRFWDQCIFALYVEDWRALRERIASISGEVLS